MLVLSRRTGESIVITPERGDWQIRLTITNIERDQIKIGFEAPADIRIARTELFANKSLPNLVPSADFSDQPSHLAKRYKTKIIPKVHKNEGH